MSNVEAHPDEIVCRDEPDPVPERDMPYGTSYDQTAVEIISAREVPLGGPRAMNVRRTLPQRQRSLIGAWCFMDHYGPDNVAISGGMDVAPHPHTGLQTVSWLFSGAIDHIDSGGNASTVLPGELNLMTGGSGICHSEVSTADTDTLHGVQLWLALPDSVRESLGRKFEHYAPQPVAFDGGSALVFLGSVLGSESPVPVCSPLVGAEIRLEPGAELAFTVDPQFEHGCLVDTGDVTVEGVNVPVNSVGYTGIGSDTLRLENRSPGSVRVLLIGGVPFGEEILMWWNFVGRDSDEIARFREQWQSGDGRFGHVDGYVGHGGPGRNAEGLSRLPAPALPNVRLRPRRNPLPHAQDEF